MIKVKRSIINPADKPMKNHRFSIHLALLSLLLGVVAAAPARAAKLASASIIERPPSTMLACGGGGSGAYRKPPRPGHQHISSDGATSPALRALLPPDSRAKPIPPQP
jgi:hypothetical protein